MLRWIATNFRTMIYAFVLALAVWVLAVSNEDPAEIRDFPTYVRIEFIGQDPGLVITEQGVLQVQVSLQAPSSVWDQLESDDESIRAVVDLSSLTEGEHTLDIQVQVDYSPVRVVSITPATIKINLESLATRTMTVDLLFVGEPAIGYIAGEFTLEPIEVTISGPESDVQKVANVQAQLSLEELRQDVNTLLPLQALDDEGNVVSGITITPDEVSVAIPIVQQGGYRDLAVKVVTRGRPASGYRLTSVSSTPLVVTVFSSDLTLINELPGYVETEPIDLTEASADIETYKNLVLPAGVTLIGSQSVQIVIVIAPIEESITISDRPVEVINLSQGLEVVVSPEIVDVILSGPLPVLNTLQFSDVRVVVDVEDLTAGTYQIAPMVEVLIDGVTVESILPGTIEVVLTTIP